MQHLCNGVTNAKLVDMMHCDGLVSHYSSLSDTGAGIYTVV